MTTSTRTAVATKFLSVFFVGSALSLAAFFFSRGVASAASEGNLIPLLGVVGTSAVALVGFRIIKRAGRGEVQ